MSKKLLLCILISFLSIISCNRMKLPEEGITREYIEKYKPDIKIKSAYIDNISLKDITLNILVEIKNNLPFEVPIEKIQINLINNSGKVFANTSTYETNEIIKIPSNSYKDVNMQFNAKYSDLFETAIESIQSKSLKYNADIVLTVSVYRKSFEFNYNTEIDLLNK